MKALSVNEAIDSLPDMAGKDITVEGILRWGFELCAIDHFPSAERREARRGEAHISNSSIWLEVGMGGLQFNAQVLEKWNGKRVIVEGALYGPDPRFGGCGHLSGWPAALLARTIQRK